MTPDWVAAHPPLVPYLDYTWAQYATRKGEAQAYYDRAATIAERLGLKVVMGVNVENCYVAGDSTACTAADLVRFGEMAVRHPASCAFLSWRYDEGDVGAGGGPGGVGGAGGGGAGEGGGGVPESRGRLIGA